MDLKKFIDNIAVLFDDTDVSEITANCKFHDLEDFSSLVSMGIIAMARTEYGKTITGADIKSCETIENLFNLINSK